MKRSWVNAGTAILVSLVWAWPCFPQAHSKQPALIRDTDTAEGKEAADDKPKEFNPALSEKSVKIGDYYFKRKNYDAAIQRYLEAIEYQPDSIAAYEALGRAYEKTHEAPKALEVYRDFLRKNPASPKASDFRQKIAKLESNQ
jgi:outer membrane protein assembly factor BamD (BamD/ComL family)